MFVQPGYPFSGVLSSLSLIWLPLSLRTLCYECLMFTLLASLVVGVALLEQESEERLGISFVCSIILQVTMSLSVWKAHFATRRSILSMEDL